MRFNIFKKKEKTTINHAGQKAYKMSPEMELYTAVVTSTLIKNFYETDTQRLKRIKTLIKKVNPNFVAKLAVYCRTKMYLRSIPVVLAVELAKIHRGDDLVCRTVNGTIQRADEITETLAYYQWANKREGTKKLNKLSKQLQKGIAQSFNKFDEYQFAKYNRKTAITLKDALFLVHPKAKDEQQQTLFDKIVQGDLQTPYTWEVELSAIGQIPYDSPELKKQAFRLKWEELIDSNRLGYMALMRNLRNMLEANVSAAHIMQIAQRLSDTQAVSRSKQLPFRFLSAYREIQALHSPYSSFILEALEQAVKVSINNLKGFDLDTRVVIASDVSGSMHQPVSPKSKVQLYDIGLLLSMLLANRSQNVITGIFGDTWKKVNLSKSNILANTMHLRSMNGQVGYSTNGYKVIEYLIKKQKVVDKVMFFTDLQMWDSRNGGNSLQSSWQTYKAKYAPDAKLYLFDLAGYGQSPIRLVGKDVFLLAGWSDKVFDVLNAIENGRSALSEIKKTEI